MPPRSLIVAPGASWPVDSGSECRRSTSIAADGRHRGAIPNGSGNGAAMEITNRFPQPLGNLAGEREIPTFPQADASFFCD
jgi:hypothetical protein